MEIEADGLAQMLKSKSSSNSINICQSNCHFREDLSSSTLTKCELPALSTLYSDQNFGIQSFGKLSDFVYSASNPNKQDRLFDGNISNTYEDATE